MNVLYCIACDIALTGTPVFVRDAISAFPQHNNFVYTPFSEKKKIFPEGTRVYSDNIKSGGARLLLSVARKLDENFGHSGILFDIVHVNTANINLAYEYVKFFKKMGAKVICHSHNVINYKNIFPYNMLIKYKKNYIIENCSLLMACSKEAGISMFGEHTKFHILKNYIDSKRFVYNQKWRDEIRQKYPAQILLGHIGAFNSQKNQHFLLELMEKLDARFSLLLVGDGEKKEECISYCKTHGLKERVYFLPSCQDIEKYYSGFDLFLMPSLHEGMPFVLLEAAASNLKQIVSDFVPYNSIFDCVYLPLEHKLWLVEILRTVEQLSGRKDNSEEIIDAGYDRGTAICSLENFYGQLMSE